MNSAGKRTDTAQRQIGFTLMELLVSVAIVGVLLIIAIPSYTSHVARAERTEARAWLLRLAADQQGYFIRHGRYATSVNELRAADTSSLTPNGDYRWTVRSTSESGFVLRATRVAADREARRCGWFELDHTQARRSGPEGPAQCWMR